MSNESFTNAQGNLVESWSTGPNGSRYAWDAECTQAKGWRQYDTDQDAWYFGVWVNTKLRLVITYAEGDLSRVTCLTPESFRAELASMAEFYGEPPPAFVVLDVDSVTHHYDLRPTGAEQ